MQDDFNKWCDQWDKALEQGIFKDAPKPHVPTSQIEPGSFFGLRNTHSQPEVNDCDVEYWKQVHELSTGQPSLLQEQLVVDTKAIAKYAQAAARSPNPVRANTIGKDQNLEPGPLGVTFSEKDIETLSELKLQLYELTSKMATFEGEGESAKKLESQIVNLKDQIDEFSDTLGQTLAGCTQGTEISQQGD